LKTLQQLAEVCGSERKVCVSRELTKIHEENARGTLAEVIEHFSKKDIKGEIVIVLEGALAPSAADDSDDSERD
jgi:16S rRNA (cytidine1402-2'-O)-methyltransferase